MKKCLAVLLLSVLIGSGVARAHMGPPMGENKGKMMMHGGDMMVADIGMILHLKQELKLTDEQVSKLQALRTSAMKDAIKREADIKTAHIDLLDVLDKASPDFASAKANAKKLSDLESQTRQAMLTTCENALNILTKEQKDMLFQHRSRKCCGMRGGGDEDEEEGEQGK
jgi:Spy/CpxP family protein refolding chaperone